MTVIPAIDLRGGRCVRLRQGDFARETVYDDDPVVLASRYADAGFRRLHIVDLDGARSGQQRHQAIVARIVETTGLMVQLGGGIRHREAIAGWLDAGVARCVIGSMAASEPDAVEEWFEAFGAESIVLALDVRTGAGHDPVLAIHGWTRDAGVTLWEAIERFLPAGLRHVLCTDVALDGTMSGPNVSLYESVRKRYPELEIQASGGVRGVEDLAALSTAGCAAAITGRALLDSAVSPEEIMSFLQDA